MSVYEMKPCKCPLGKRLLIIKSHPNGSYHVRCGHCEIEGAVRETVEQAIAAWDNEIMRVECRIDVLCRLEPRNVRNVKSSNKEK